MAIRLITRFGDGLGLLHRMHREGSECSFYTSDVPTKRCLVGIVPAADTDTAGRDDLHIFDMVGQGARADSLRKDGYRVYGASALADSMEMDRVFFLKIATAHGLAVPDYDLFSPEKLTGDDLWVFKFAKGTPAAWAFVPTSVEEQNAFVEFATERLKGDILIQRKVEGVDCGIGCFYHNGDPIMDTVHSSIDFTRFMSGGVGPITSGTGCVAWWWKNPRNKLWRATHEKLLPFLKRFSYTGPLTIKVCIAGKDRRAYVQEAVARFDFPAMFALCGGIGVSVSQFVERLIRGQIGDLGKTNDWLGAVLLTLPPYPSMVDASVTEGRKISEQTVESKDFWASDVMKDDAYRTAGADGIVGCVTCTASSLPGLETALYERVRSVVLLDKQYRNDIVSEATRRLNLLKEWKYVS